MKRFWILVLAVLLSGCVTMGEKKPIDHTSVFAKAGLNIDTNSNDKADVPYGGSDAGTFTDGGILIGAGTGAFEVTALGAVGGILYGTGVNPAWLAAGATGKMLIAKGAAAPEWTPYTFPATVPTVGKVLISDGTNLIGSTALGTAAYTASTAYEPADAAIVKSDEAETLTGNWVNTDNPWADNEVSDTLTASIFVGTGSTTDAVDLATAEVAGVLPVANIHGDIARDSEADTLCNATTTDHSVPRFNGTNNKTLQGSGIIIDDSDNITGAASITTAASATPTITFNDSTGAGASKFAGKILMNMTTTTDDAETADIGIYAIYGGDVNDVGYLVAEYDGSAESWTFGDETIGEDLKFDFSTAGKVTVTSPGGGTVVDFSALAINTTGIITGGSQTPLAGTAADFDDNFTGAYLYGGTYRVTTAGACALPEATVGMNFTILHEVAGASTIESLTGGTADTIFMNGLSAGSDDDLTASAVGAMCVFQYQAANVWMATCNGFTEVAP